MTNTLLVLAQDRREFDMWARTWGIRLKNTQVVYASDEKATKGYPTKGTYYTILSGFWNRKTAELAEKVSRYTFLPQDKIEKRLKSVSVQHVPDNY